MQKAFLLSVSLNKLLVGTLLALVCISSYADDLKVADDFKSGDLVSADTFNQIFATIEKINRTVVDSDLVGVWSCSAVHLGNSSFDATGWTKKDFIYELSTSQVNFTASSSSTSKEAAYTFTTSSPSPFWRKSSSSSNSADTGTYILYDGMLVTKNLGGINEAYPLSVEVVSDTRIILTALWKANELSERIVCDSAEAVPASPTSPSASIDADNKRITIAWTDASNDETGFKVYRKLSSETEYSLLTALIGETSYADPNVTENLTAYYQITAYNDNGESAKSKTVSEIGDYTAPSVTSTSPAAASSVPQSDFSDPPAPGTLPVVFSFSEAVTTWPYCDPCTDTSLFSLTVNGTDSPSKLSAPAGVKLLGNSLQANLTYEAGATYVLTLSNEFIRDANGNVMKDDYSLTWTTP